MFWNKNINKIKIWDMMILDFILECLIWLTNNVWMGFIIPAHIIGLIKNLLNGNFLKGIIF
jgi:hypothetical protein